MNINMRRLGSFDPSLAESPERSGWELPSQSTLSPISTICIIALSVEASSAEHLMNVDCIRNKRKMIECHCRCLRRYVVFICVTAKKITALRLGVCHDHAPSENTDFQRVILLDEPCSAPGHLPALSSTGAPFKKFCMF